MRLIDADALYERTAEWEAQALHMVEVTMNDEDKTEWRKWSAVLAERSAFKHDIADAPTIDPEPNWIPVTERLPRNEDSVLITDYDYFIDIGYFDGRKWNYRAPDIGTPEVAAWMSLPEPYRSNT